MTVNGRSNNLVLSVGVVVLAMGTAWGAPPVENEGRTAPKAAGSTVGTSGQRQTIDQDGNVVTRAATRSRVQAKSVTEAHAGTVEPMTFRTDGPSPSADVADASSTAAAAVQAPILDAASSQFGFQALLTDGAGDPLPGPTVSLVFRLYDGLGMLLDGPIGPFVVPITNGIVDTQVPMIPKLFDGTARELGVTVDGGVELSPRVKLVAVPYALRVDRVRSAELDDTIDLGAVDANGQLRIWSNTANRRTIQLQGSSHTVTIMGADGSSNAILGGEPFGELRLRDLTGNDETVSLTATANSGGELSLRESAGVLSLFADGGTGVIHATDGFRILDAIPGNEVMSAFRFSGGPSNGGAQLRFKDGAGVNTMQGGTSSNGGGFWVLKQSDGDNGVFLNGGAGANVGGSVNVFDAQANLTIDLDGDGHQIGLTANNGEDRVRLAGVSTGVLLLSDGNGLFGTAPSDRTVTLSAGPDFLVAPTGPGNDFGGQLLLDRSDGVATIFMNGGNSLGTGTRIATTGSHQVLSSITPTAPVLGSLEPGSSGGVLFLYQGDGDVGVELDGDAGTNAGADLVMRASTGTATIFIDADSGDAGLIQLRDVGGSTRVQLDGQSTGTGGEVSIYDSSGTETIELLGDEASGGEGSAQIMLRRSDGADRIEIDADGGSGSRIQLLNTAGSAVIMDGEVNGGGRIRVRNALNATRIFIDGDFSGTGLSRIRADVFRVQGGVDLAEPFECKDQDTLQPGTVMSIDPNSPGKLMMSTEAYDRKVAGIISGAGGVRPGITLSQEGVMDQGKLVALTGRVYCMADASNGAITPGDLLTTSNTPGHAMKVLDYARAQGAIIGKAMTPLETGKGLILVLVQPQ